MEYKIKHMYAQLLNQSNFVVGIGIAIWRRKHYWGINIFIVYLLDMYTTLEHPCEAMCGMLIVG